MALEDETIGATLRRYRSTRMSQTQLADALRDASHPDVNQTTISRIENGDRALRYREAITIAHVLGLDLAAFTGENPSTPDAYRAGYRAALRDISRHIATEEEKEA